MNPLGTLPPGVRLDSWPNQPVLQTSQDHPEVARLKEELRKRMPELIKVLEVLAALSPIQELAGKLAAPPLGILVTQTDQVAQPDQAVAL